MVIIGEKIQKQQLSSQVIIKLEEIIMTKNSIAHGYEANLAKKGAGSTKI